MEYSKNFLIDIPNDTGQRKVVTEFPLSALLEERLSYVQNGKDFYLVGTHWTSLKQQMFVEYKGSEPRQDSFRFHVRDTSANQSPTVQLDIVIEVSCIKCWPVNIVTERKERPT